MEKYVKRTGFSGIVTLLIAISLFFTGCNNVQTVNTYSKAENWAYPETDAADKEADVFFICPTVYGGDSEAFNMALDDTETKENFLGATNMEKGIYDTDCRFFAPYYRQTTLNVYEMDISDREPYLNIAYEDVKLAFESYMEHYNNGRPIVLAGFSQGADSSIRLLKDYFSDDKTNDLLVACYAIGWSITEAELQEYEHLKFAQSETEDG